MTATYVHIVELPSVPFWAVIFILLTLIAKLNSVGSNAPTFGNPSPNTIWFHYCSKHDASITSPPNTLFSPYPPVPPSLLLTLSSEKMPSIHMPIRQYPSTQTMRQVDGRHQTSLESSINHGHHGKSNGAYQKIFPPIGVQDFQEFPIRRTAIGHPNTTSRARDAPSPMPTDFPSSLYSQAPFRFGSTV